LSNYSNKDLKKLTLTLKSHLKVEHSDAAILVEEKQLKPCLIDLKELIWCLRVETNQNLCEESKNAIWTADVSQSLPRKF
jgi:hypothetical protein